MSGFPSGPASTRYGGPRNHAPYRSWVEDPRRLRSRQRGTVRTGRPETPPLAQANDHALAPT
eukprot:1431378-Pyramimonas_sp.AAC.1